MGLGALGCSCPGVRAQAGKPARHSGGDPGDQETCSTWLEVGQEQTWEPMSPWPTASQFVVFNLLLLIPAEQGKP